MIEAVIFDFGGVISMPQKEELLYPWAEERTGLDKAAFWKGYKLFRHDFDAGLCSGDEMYRRILEHYGKPYTEALLSGLTARDLESWTIPNPETLVWEKALKVQGFKTGILTNMPTEFIPKFDACAHEFRQLVDAEVVSAEVKLAKPDPEIYALMLHRLGDIPPENAIFFDDLQPNIDGARAVGLHAERFTGVAAAKAALEALVRG